MFKGVLQAETKGHSLVTGKHGSIKLTGKSKFTVKLIM